ncbi:hypothetical protein X975_03225, partial [Stegodyphus mimosarum]
MKSEPPLWFLFFVLGCSTLPPMIELEISRPQKTPYNQLNLMF